VLTFANNGDLRYYLRNKFIEITWNRRIQILHDIGFNLSSIHSRGIIHGDLHPGNILRLKDNVVAICDMGTSMATNSNKEKGPSFGVMPYVAPEILRGGARTMESDIYALGVVMWEWCAGKPPFGQRPFDSLLALDICDGLRPEPLKGLPDFYHDLMIRCWHQDPLQRPTSKDMYKIVGEWMERPTPEIEEQIRTAEEFRIANTFKYDSKESYNTHPLAIYTSRALPIIIPNMNIEINENGM
jgi:serine/threonine protein kinase